VNRLSLADLLEATIRLYRRAPLPLLLISAVVQVPAGFVSGVLGATSQEAFLRLGTAAPRDISAADVQALLGLTLGFLALAIVVGVASYLSGAATMHAAATMLTGDRASVRGAYGAVLRKLGALLGSLLLSAGALIALALGLVIILVLVALILGPTQAGIGGPAAFATIVLLVAFVVGIVFLSVRWAVSVPAIMIEGRGPAEGLGRSWRLVTGSTWRVLGIMLVFSIALGLLLTLAQQLVLTLPLGDLSSLTSGTVLYGAAIAITSTLAAPILPIMVTLLFLDLRFRSDGVKEIFPGGSTAATGPGPS